MGEGLQVGLSDFERRLKSVVTVYGEDNINFIIGFGGDAQTVGEEVESVDTVLGGDFGVGVED